MESMTKLIVIVLCIFNTTPIIINAQLPHDIFILAGQSNMAGRGGVTNGHWDGFVPPECRPSSDILRFDAQQSWVLASEPLHADIDVGKTCGVGPGLGFARAIHSISGSRVGVIGLVPCAVGGTKIGEWARGTDLYNRLVARAKAAVLSGGTIRAVLWYQGESDTIKLEEAKAYRGNMERLIRDLRYDLGNSSLSIIQVALASGEGRYVDLVREAQLGIKLPNIKCVDAKGLNLGPDHLHLTTMSQVHLGFMLARSFLNITPTNNNSFISSTPNSSLL